MSLHWLRDNIVSWWNYVYFNHGLMLLERLSDIRDMLRMLADECPGEVPVSDCPILAFLTARRKDQQHNKKHQAAQDERSPRAKGVLS